MANDRKRMVVNIQPELESELDKLKQEKFSDSSQSEMIRFLIRQGLKSVRTENTNHNKIQK